MRALLALLVAVLWAVTVMLPAGASAAEQLEISSAGIGGAIHVFATGWAKLINQHTPVVATVVSTGAGKENIRLLTQRKTEVGYVFSPLFSSERQAGLAGFENLRGIYTYFYGGFQWVVRADAGVSSIADLKGKRFSVGAPGTTAQVDALAMLADYGIRRDQISAESLTLSVASQQVKDGKLVGMFFQGPTPAAVIIDVATARKIRLLPIDEKIADKWVREQPAYLRGEWRGDEYPNQENEGPVPTLMATLTVTSHKDVPEGVIYRATKALFEHLNEFHVVHREAKHVQLDKALAGMQVPLHRGALRFFREKGIAVPDRLLPPEGR